jgi:hypothetical protein
VSRRCACGSGAFVHVDALSRGTAGERGDYLWCGELRVWNDEILMGWYAARDGSVRSKGTLYFVPHPQGITMTGRWVGLSDDRQIMTGWGSMAKSDEEARSLVERLREQESGSDG